MRKKAQIPSNLQHLRKGVLYARALVSVLSILMLVAAIRVGLTASWARWRRHYRFYQGDFSGADKARFDDGCDERQGESVSVAISQACGPGHTPLRQIHFVPLLFAAGGVYVDSSTRARSRAAGDVSPTATGSAILVSTYTTPPGRTSATGRSGSAMSGRSNSPGRDREGRRIAAVGNADVVNTDQLIKTMNGRLRLNLGGTSASTQGIDGARGEGILNVGTGSQGSSRASHSTPHLRSIPAAFSSKASNTGCRCGPSASSACPWVTFPASGPTTEPSGCGASRGIRENSGSGPEKAQSGSGA